MDDDFTTWLNDERRCTADAPVYDASLYTATCNRQFQSIEVIHGTFQAAGKLHGDLRHPQPPPVSSTGCDTGPHGVERHSFQFIAQLGSTQPELAVSCINSNLDKRQNWSFHQKPTNTYNSIFQVHRHSRAVRFVSLQLSTHHVTSP
ncbi:hypothetical protein FPSE_12320 [Fusarium pseudograminearum CS3096]|uniref:Uncharacterized protein n=1 Tax=Fusarium pseudograminearum (strain CS3096) TaxID=1028729 RepID=K3VWG2_FUSPC|nr:hypothetical protein FPSE_12320 [Fusarium pseudograminearum CS3096]EKJ67505.1 hypothetical protein FPSE_12320 [Fusarium pseudograminearum CS3096]